MCKFGNTVKMNSWQFEILFTLGFLMQLLVKT